MLTQADRDADDRRRDDAGPVVVTYCPPARSASGSTDIASVAMFTDGSTRTGYRDGSWCWTTQVATEDDYDD